MDDESLEQQIAKVKARNRELTVHRDKLAANLEANNQRAAYLSHLYDKNERLEQEIAAMEGRPRDEEDDDGEDPPEPPRD